MENNKKHSLGKRAFILFLSKRMKGVILVALIVAAVWYVERWVPADYQIWGVFTVQIIQLIGLAYLFMVLFWTYMEYRYYTYMFTDEAFVMTSGYIMRNEVAALYHQIQNVNIQRSPLDRITGVSQIIIFMTGSEKESTHNKIMLPAVGKKKAKIVQKELLVRARKHVPNAI